MARSKKAATTDAEGKKINKAERIRAAAKAMGKNVRPRDIIAELAKEGIVVSSAQVSTTLKSLGYRRKRRKKHSNGAAPATASKKMNGHRLDLESLMAAKALIEKVGSIQKAEEALSVLKKLQ